MKSTQNINLISLLNPNLIGVIFYPSSLRFVGILFPIDSFIRIKKVGVFVKHTIEHIVKKGQKYVLDFYQLHGDESISLCEELYKNNLSIIKVFRINKTYSFIQKYTNYSSYFLFDTHCLEYGGSGRKFSWNKLSEYTFNTQILLSGGIGIEDVERIKNIFNSKYIGIDLNSRFEIEPGDKNRDELRRFVQKINL